LIIIKCLLAVEVIFEVF